MTAPQPPQECPCGHQLAAGRVLLAEVPCSCPGASVTGRHFVWTCRPCVAQNRDAAYYDPPHFPVLQPGDPPVTVAGRWRVTNWAPGVARETIRM